MHNENELKLCQRGSVWWHNIDPVNVLVPDDNKSLPESDVDF